MLSLGYVVSALGAYLFLGEVIPPQRLVAIGVIMLGVILLART
jgi:drug/metabolite transporter (DMT)-like permease